MNPIAFSTRSIIFSAAAALFACMGVQTTATGADTGTLRITFKLNGSAKDLPPIKPNVDQAFCGQNKIPDEMLVVNPENKGIANVIVYVYTGRRGTVLPKMDLKSETHELANKDCRFEPRVVIAKKGDTIKVTNPDMVGHNANFQFFNNKQQNLTVPAGGSVDVSLEEAEPAPIPVDCNIHNWMHSQLVVLDGHPFGAVSDENGVLEISGLPVGEVVFRANHLNGSLKEVIIDGKETDWRSSKFEVEIKAGMNDMGTVEVPVAAFD